MKQLESLSQPASPTPPRPPLPDTTAERDRLIEQYREYAHRLASQIKATLPTRVDMSELTAYADLGLVEAAEKFDPTRGVAFTTFAYYRIRGAVYDGLLLASDTAKSGALDEQQRRAAHVNDLLGVYADDDSAVSAEKSRTVDDDIAQVGNTIETLVPVYLLSLDDAALDASDDALPIDNLLERRELAEKARESVSALPAEDRRLIEAVYFKNMSIAAHARQLGISRSWMTRLHAKAIDRLRRLMKQRGIVFKSSKRKASA